MYTAMKTETAAAGNVISEKRRDSTIEFYAVQISAYASD
jgi:hypothetical protein